MEFIFKIFTWRNLFIAASAAALLMAADRWQHYPRRWYREWRYPPQNGTAPGCDEIMRLDEKRESAELERRYERVMALIARAKSDGFDVSGLERRAALALRLNDARYRRGATAMLAGLEGSVPLKKSRYRPRPAADDEEDIPRDVPGRKAGGRRR